MKDLKKLAKLFQEKNRSQIKYIQYIKGNVKGIKACQYEKSTKHKTWH